MADIAKMKERVIYLRDQANWLREMGHKSNNDREMAARFEQLAHECEGIAEKIERNLPVHERVSKPTA
jgi:hypothetical protein